MITKLYQFALQFLTKHFLIFFIIGVTAATLDYVLYIQFLSYGLPMLVAKILSSVLAVFLNYILNSRFNFGGSHTMSLKSTLAYGTLYAGLIFLHALFNEGFYLLFRNINLAVFCALVLSAGLNYLAVKKFFAHYHTT